MALNIEIWKPVRLKNVQPWYEVSNCGRVRNIVTGKFLTPSPDKGGYLMVGFTYKDKRRRNIAVHRIVALTFIPNPNPAIDTTVNHKDGDKTHNYVTNLEWMSNADNVRDMYAHGRHPTRRGEDIGNSRYTEAQIHQVCKLLEQEIPNKEIWKMTGVPTNIIGFIKRRVLWIHISKNYDFKGPSPKIKYEKYFELFDEMIAKGATWAEVKSAFSIHGNQTKCLRELYKRRYNKHLKVQRLSK